LITPKRTLEPMCAGIWIYYVGNTTLYDGNGRILNGRKNYKSETALLVEKIIV